MGNGKFAKAPLNYRNTPCPYFSLSDHVCASAAGSASSGAGEAAPLVLFGELTSNQQENELAGFHTS